MLTVAEDDFREQYDLKCMYKFPDDNKKEILEPKLFSMFY